MSHKDCISLSGTFSEQFGEKKNCVNFISGGQTYFVFLDLGQVVPAGQPVVAHFEPKPYLGVESRKGVPTPYVGMKLGKVFKFDKV